MENANRSGYIGAVDVEAATGTGPSGDVNPSVAYKAAVWSAHYAGKLAEAR